MCILKGFYVHFRDGAKLQKYFINNNIFSKILLAASRLFHLKMLGIFKVHD